MQQNCLLTVAAALLVFLAGMSPAMAAPARPDPLLAPPQGPCDPHLNGPDYVAGTDAEGRPVAPADLPGPKIPVPDGILVPLGGQTAQGGGSRAQALAELSPNDVAAILNANPACPSARKAR